MSRKLTHAPSDDLESTVDSIPAIPPLEGIWSNRNYQ